MFKLWITKQNVSVSICGVWLMSLSIKAVCFDKSGQYFLIYLVFFTDEHKSLFLKCFIGLTLIR